MKKQLRLLMVVVVLLICLPVTSLASVTKGQITFYEDTSFEYPSDEQQSNDPPDSTEESSGDDVTTSSSRQVIGGADSSHSSSHPEQAKESHKNQQTLLQTNETLSYVASVLGSLILIFALYKIRRNIS